MKKILLAIGFSILTFFAQAQSLQTDEPLKMDTIGKHIVDYAKIRAYYTYRFAKDAKYPDAKQKTITLLQIGDKYNRFMDYNKFRSDSINDAAALGGKSAMEIIPTLMGLGNACGFDPNVVFDKENRVETFQEKIAVYDTHEYTESIPNLSWQLQEGDSIIKGFHCQKASTIFRGRTYIAWYTLEQAIPYGPYKFMGTPGLIVTINDTQNNFSFELCGLEKINYRDPIYIWDNKKIVHSNRKEMREIYKNYCANPAKALLNSDLGIEISDEVLATISPKPYNPIELE